ncbi:ABC transporter substrate-binding protein [Bosea sp. (in: a-proteobacteria)]|uniref:ABC transporter substrate-binding protein n=1 Tax=Bosea sp. (in: a-proteobacteria) TaxID=1871050 RepID=UPI002733E180|nr:ABC transporter substrate-binding protein [Bosea sp. (in: a-proteobacteria)]MDP3407729.1 ABC transporter substrate-binding protein [Bosea sp. (in: a-proteobacteria)]
MGTKRSAVAAFALGALIALPAQAQDKPKELVVGIATFLSGPASVFGVPGRNAADLFIEELNAKGGILGVPVKPVYVDEGAGTNQLISEYRRVVQDQGAQVMFGAISSGSCNALAPVAEDLKVVNVMWDCGTQTIFEEGKWKYSVRTQGHAGAEMMATLLYLMKVKPDFKTIAVVNQDYAWGRESWALFQAGLKALKPDVRIVAELFPKFGAPDFSTEITRLSALRPDVVLSTSWGGDLDTFVQQAAARGLLKQSTFVLPLAESSMERLGAVMPEGVIVGGRGDHYFLHPKHKNSAEMQNFVKKYREKTNVYPIYPTFHMNQAVTGLTKAYEKASAANGGKWPTKEQVIAAFEGLEFKSLTGTITIRSDHQGLEDQLLGTTKRVPEYPFAVYDKMALYPGKLVTTPVGEKSLEWFAKIKPDLVNDKSIETFEYSK